MFESVFVKVFETVAGGERPPAAEDSEDLLQSIAALLSEQESQLGEEKSGAVYEAIAKAAKSKGQSAERKGIENFLLQIYKETLRKRIADRKAAFRETHEFEESVNKFLDRKVLTIDVPRSRARSVVVIKAKNGHTYGISSLSSGERQILTMLYSASRGRYDPGIFLVDEPELSLHIDWQRIVLRELQAQAPRRQIIACTHSPEVGAEHLDCLIDFDPVISARQSALFSDDEN
jgi:predicted ATP-dependent endonuclease of OLD family